MRITTKQRGVLLTPELEEYVERRIQFAFGRFAPRIRSVLVRLDDVNGPRGGIDKFCRIEVESQGGLRYMVNEQQADLRVAISLAAARIGRTVQRQMTSAEQWRKVRVSTARVPRSG